MEAINDKEELTAEWTVHAQLKLVRPSDVKRSQSLGRLASPRSDARSTDGGNTQTFVYKWRSDCPDKAITDTFDASKVNSGSFNATHTMGTDSGIDSQGKNPQCTSTCSIVLTACADLMPQLMRETTENDFSSSLKTENDTDSKDAAVQTSDCEVYYTKDWAELETRRKQMQELRKLVEESRECERQMLSPPNKLDRSPNFQSPTNTISSKASQSSRNRCCDSAGAKKKPPRTVHIDVYCTASDAEDTSGGNSPSKVMSPTCDNQSNATPQTVFESEEMKLRQRFVAGKELPRKLASTPTNSSGNLFPLKKSSTKDEIDESKQMLFNKYLGDQAQIRKFNAMKSRMNPFRRDISDDAISSNYPNSSLSTFRDATCSSVSSFLQQSVSIEEVEPESYPASRNSLLYPSDSFEYANSEDKLRIKIMDQNVWASKTSQFNSPEVERKFLYEQKKMQDSYLKRKRMGMTQKSHSDSEENSEEDALQEFVFEKFNKMKNASSRSLDISNTDSVDTVKCCQPEKTATGDLPKAGSKDVVTSSGRNSRASTLKSFTPDIYSDDYLSRAKNFGRLIGGLRKPGHHIGPVRNPECLCDHCRQWMAEREQYRTRAQSVGELMPITRLQKWKRGENVD
ncbi:uncharacterized protein LOC134832407 [Culicoides brevitarsis]|uniref:uncharacterized protein LOC134832407 n=1 Tax=Culicoides brevitarsis TaxID=469753 RepID=UPI00307BD4AC